jgi:hypothetical protein
VGGFSGGLCWKDGSGHGMTKGMENIAETRLDDGVSVGDGHGNGFGKPSEGVGDAFSLGGPYPSSETTIMVKGWSHVPTINSVGGPSLASVDFLMDHDMDAWWGNGCRIEVELAMDLSPCR